MESDVSSLRSLDWPTCFSRHSRGLRIRDFARRREVDEKGAIVAGQCHHQAGVTGRRSDLGGDGVATRGERAGCQAPVAA